MKRNIVLLFCFIGLSLSACSTNKSNKAQEDSLAAAAAADSMLKEALKADSLEADTDSI